MKKILVTVIVLFVYNSSIAQEKKMHSILTSAIWKIDLESLKENLKPLIENEPSYKDLALNEKEVALKAVLDSQNLTFNFSENGSYKLNINNESDETGTYKLNSKKKQLTITNKVTKEILVYNILSIEDSKMILVENEDVLELVFLSQTKN